MTSASTAQLVSPRAKMEAPAASSASPASFKTRPSKRRANHAMQASTGRSMTLHFVVSRAKRVDTKKKRSRLRVCRAFLVCFSRRKARRNATLVTQDHSRTTRLSKRAPLAQQVTLHQKLVVRAATSAHAVNFKIEKATKVASNVRVVVNSMQTLMLVFLLQIVKHVPKVNTNRRTEPRFVFHV